MRNFFADLHIHIGMNEDGKWVKIPTSSQLTLRNILHEACTRKGMDIIGVVDAMSPLVQSDLERLIQEGSLVLAAGGGYRYENKITLLLGAEIETAEEQGGLSHTLIFLPDITSMHEFSLYMARFIRNIYISSQNAHMELAKLVDIASSFEAAIIPAHVFTPHKSLYGTCANRLSQLLPDKEMQKISAIELGLSADTFMADRIAELSAYSYVTNSDAHSLAKIAREYNVIKLAEPSWSECLKALARREGRHITCNYGLNPLLGKYHATLCAKCNQLIMSRGDEFTGNCPYCNSHKIIKGVSNRINEIADYSIPVHPAHRPDYCYQIPLEFIPGLGSKSLDRLLAAFGTEMKIIHETSNSDLASVVGDTLAQKISRARAGDVAISAGGGGRYGKLMKNS